MRDKKRDAGILALTEFVFMNYPLYKSTVYQE